MYGKYITERTNKHIIETDKGFAVYSYTQEGVYVEEIFVERDFRKSGVASELADKIADEAKSKGFKLMFGSVCPAAKGSTASLKVLLAYGFELLSSQDNLIFMKKEI